MSAARSCVLVVFTLAVAGLFSFYKWCFCMSMTYPSHCSVDSIMPLLESFFVLFHQKIDFLFVLCIHSLHKICLLCLVHLQRVPRLHGSPLHTLFSTRYECSIVCLPSQNSDALGTFSCPSLWCPIARSFFVFSVIKSGPTSKWALQPSAMRAARFERVCVVMCFLFLP